MSTQSVRYSGWHGGSREQAWQRLTEQQPWDLIVIGGGIAGAGVLREAARRGLKAVLVERRDFAWGTSSRSSKMVHGGLRYLGSGQYRMTRDSVCERERLLKEAPGLVDNLHFLMPHFRRQFPGRRSFGALLWVYDRIAGQRNHEFHAAARALQWAPGLPTARLRGATRFADAVTDDARLVLRVLDEALADGAGALNYTAATGLQRRGGRVSGVEVRDEISGASATVQARAVVNATGVWVDELRQQLGAQATLRPLRGSHLVFPFWRLPVAASVSLFHPQDRRPVFVFPWEGVTVVGTTDLDHQTPLDEEARISPEELAYLLKAANHAFPAQRLSVADIQCTWAGVRPVVGGNAASPSREKREHAVLDDAGLISIAGGKLTTFRLIALDVLARLQRYLPRAAEAPADAAMFRKLPEQARPPRVATQQWQRLQGHYGRHAPAVLSTDSVEAVAETNTLWAELSWSAANEAVVHLDDLLLRRTRLGLLLPNGGSAWLERIRKLCQKPLGWDDVHWRREVERYREIWQRYYSVPQPAAGNVDVPASARTSDAGPIPVRHR
jgi:glycerol-3-phosphate dehydrogenase